MAEKYDGWDTRRLYFDSSYNSNSYNSSSYNIEFIESLIRIITRIATYTSKYRNLN